MDKKVELTRKEVQLIEELTTMIAEIDGQNNPLKESLFRGLASYVEGIKVGLNFQQMSAQKVQA